MRKSGYEQTIRESLASIGKIGVDPFLVEAWMRLEHGTLDALSLSQFRREAETCAALVEQDPETSARLAESFGLA